MISVATLLANEMKEKLYSTCIVCLHLLLRNNSQYFFNDSSAISRQLPLAAFFR